MLLKWCSSGKGEKKSWMFIAQVAESGLAGRETLDELSGARGGGGGGGRGPLGALQDPSLCVLLPTSHLNVKAEPPEACAKCAGHVYLCQPTWKCDLGWHRVPRHCRFRFTLCSVLHEAGIAHLNVLSLLPPCAQQYPIIVFIYQYYIIVFIYLWHFSRAHSDDSLVFSSSQGVFPHLIELGRLILGGISSFLLPRVDSYFSLISNHLWFWQPGQGGTRPADTLRILLQVWHHFISQFQVSRWDPSSQDQV